MEDLKQIQEFFSKPLEEATFKKGDKVTYLGHPAVITATKEYNGRNYVSVSYDKGKGKTKASDILTTDGSVKPLKETFTPSSTFIKDKNNPNFLYVSIPYEVGSGFSTALGKRTMSGQTRDMGSKTAMKKAIQIAEKLESMFNIEDIDVTDQKNGKILIFAVSDDFENMSGNEIKATLLREHEEYSGITTSNKQAVNEGKLREFELELINKNGKRIVQKIHANPETAELFDIIANLKKSPNIKDVKIKKLVNEEKIEVDKDTKFQLDLTHLLDKHVVKEIAEEVMKEKGYLKGFSKYLESPDNPKGETPGLTDKVLSKILMRIGDEVKETIELGKNLEEGKLCPKGEAYRKRRMAAGEKSSAYLSGRAVKVCKGQISGRKKRKKRKSKKKK